VAKGTGKGGGKDEKPLERVVAENRKARHEYEIIDTLECGIALVGSEVKSLRVGRMSLDEAYGRIEGDEAWLYGCDIPEYEKASGNSSSIAVRSGNSPDRPSRRG
jgi:SsrA-binding protein